MAIGLSLNLDSGRLTCIVIGHQQSRLGAEVPCNHILLVRSYPGVGQAESRGPARPGTLQRVRRSQCHAATQRVDPFGSTHTHA